MGFVYKVKFNEDKVEILKKHFESSGYKKEVLEKTHCKDPRYESALFQINGITTASDIIYGKYLILPKLYRLKEGSLDEVIKNEFLDENGIKLLESLNGDKKKFVKDELIVVPPKVWLDKSFGQKPSLKYKVHRDRYLWDIALEELDNPLLDKNIAQINQIPYENKVSKGKVLTLPLPDEYPISKEDTEHWNKIKKSLDEFFSKSDGNKMEAARRIYCQILEFDWLEGYRSCMYKDHRGILTIGIGTNINSPDDFKKKGVKDSLYVCEHKRDENSNCLVDNHLDKPKPETLDKIYHEAKRSSSRGVLPCAKEVILSYADAKKIAEDHLEQRCSKAIKLYFENYLDYPLPALVALFDLIYKLGDKGFVTKFPSCTKAFREKNWNKAAQESYVAEKQPDEEKPASGVRKRNILVYELLKRSVEFGKN